MIDSPRIGVLGIGAMGFPLAQALRRRFEQVRVFDRDQATLDRASRHGLASAASLSGLLDDVDVLVTVVSGNAEVEALVEAEVGLPGNLARGALWIDVTSTAPDTLVACEETSHRAGVQFVAAPMRGSPQNAVDGSLAFWLAGHADAREEARPILEALGGPSCVTVVGDRAQDAAVVKLLSNLLWFGQVVATSEALLLGRSLGLEPGRLADLLRGGPGGSAYLDGHVDFLLEGDYLEHFPLERVIEELEIVVDLARRNRVPFEMSELVLGLHERARAVLGAADGELSAARLLEHVAGTELRRTSDSPLYP